MLKKFSYISLILGMIFFFVFQGFVKFYNINLNYFFLLELENLKFSFILDISSFSFLFMLALVTNLVANYSEIYMEHYNNKKFMMLMSLFFVSMIFMVMSSSSLCMMIGWDFLGLTSICLIMFYPNKMTMNNSIMTMFFNRLGDIMFIMIISLIFFEFSLFYFFISESKLFFMILVMICGFTKSAQFPLSSWLPAAMSAPTPISAMVHSSTLVTAGIFMLHKIYNYFMLTNSVEILNVLTMTTFLVGSILTLLEMDLKKIIAFSTMSQISMILVLCSLNLINLSLSHMIFHAFFKTVLFCCSGMIFVSNFSDQIYKFMKNYSMMESTLFFLGIYSMSGLFFSSSFYSKDLVLEFLCENSEIWYEFMLVGSTFTLFYSSKLMFTCYSWLGKFKLLTLKSSKIKMMMMFMMFMMFSDKILKMFLFSSFNSSINWNDLLIMFLTMNSFIFLNQNNMKFKNFSIILSQNISFMKYFLFSMWSKMMNFKIMSNSDEMFFKSAYFNLMKMKSSNNKSSFFIMFMVLSILMLLKV